MIDLLCYVVCIDDDDDGNGLEKVKSQKLKLKVILYPFGKMQDVMQQQEKGTRPGEY